MARSAQELERLATTISMLSIDAVEKANSGHPGLPMGASLVATTLWANHLTFDPSEPRWINRDRFVLSAGHGSALLYSLLHLFGYDLSIEEVKAFRQWGSVTPGHPEFGMTPGVEATTGPLGQGFGNAVGMALGGKLLQSQYGSDVINYTVYALASDGDLMEGVSCEATSLAGHLGLNNLVVLYDDNKITLAGETAVCFTESVPERYRACGWFVQEVDGHDSQAIDEAICKAKSESSRPSLICTRTVIGYGSPVKAGTFGAHGSPLGAEEVAATKKHLGWPGEEPFFIPGEVNRLCNDLITEKKSVVAAWKKTFAAWQESHAEATLRLTAQFEREIPSALREKLLAGIEHNRSEATRDLSGKILQVIAEYCPYLVGGSADLETSTKTLIKSAGEVQRDSFEGRNIRYGVREHAMGAMTNGLAYERCWIPFASTFLVFSDYVRPSIRLAALSHLQSLYIFTHDSFWVGEDGPTHQPIEHIQSLRLIPNLYVFRPADGLETSVCYLAALEAKDKPTVMVLTRQGLPPLKRHKDFVSSDILRGGYLVQSSGVSDELVLVASGSEVALAVEAAAVLAKSKIATRIVSVPSVELFLNESQEYRDSVIPPSSKKVVIEAGRSIGWERVVGSQALFCCMDRFGASAPGEVLAEKFGFTAMTLSAEITEWLK